MRWSLTFNTIMYKQCRAPAWRTNSKLKTNFELPYGGSLGFRSTFHHRFQNLRQVCIFNETILILTQERSQVSTFIFMIVNICTLTCHSKYNAIRINSQRIEFLTRRRDLRVQTFKMYSHWLICWLYHFSRLPNAEKSICFGGRGRYVVLLHFTA